MLLLLLLLRVVAVRTRAERIRTSRCLAPAGRLGAEAVRAGRAPGNWSPWSSFIGIGRSEVTGSSVSGRANGSPQGGARQLCLRGCMRVATLRTGVGAGNRASRDPRLVE